MTYYKIIKRELRYRNVICNVRQSIFKVYFESLSLPLQHSLDNFVGFEPVATLLRYRPMQLQPADTNSRLLEHPSGCRTSIGSDPAGGCQGPVSRDNALSTSMHLFESKGQSYT